MYELMRSVAISVRCFLHRATTMVEGLSELWRAPDEEEERAEKKWRPIRV